MNRHVLIPDDLIGTNTVMIAANNQRVSDIGFYDPLSLEAYRMQHNLPEATLVHIVTQEGQQ